MSSDPRRPRRDQLAVDPVTVARTLLGCDVVSGEVRIKIVEAEAYGGPPDGRHPDPAAHSFRGPTARSAVMFGPAGHAYVYRSYGIHMCLNVTCGADGEASAVLIRSGVVIDGHRVVRRRRERDGVAPAQHRWGMGPGNLGAALGVDVADSGRDLLDPSSDLRLTLGEVVDPTVVRSGPRVGLTVATERPWRFWIAGSSSVSAFRPGSASIIARRAEQARALRDTSGAGAAAADGGPNAQGSDW